MAAGTIEPRRLALRYAPPGIIVEYAHTRQLFHHEIDLQDVLLAHHHSRASLDIDAVVAKLIAAHERVLGDRKVSTRQLARLVWKLIDQTAPPRDAAAGGGASADVPPAAALPQADYNRVSETQLKQVKLKMDLVFQQNIVRPGEHGYQYDKQVAFQPTQEASDWDDDE